MDYKTIEYKLDIEHLWIKQLYDALGTAEIRQNFINQTPCVKAIIDHSLGTGGCFFLPINKYMSAAYANIDYKVNVRFRLINKEAEFYVLDYSLLDGSKTVYQHGTRNTFSLKDSSLEAEYAPGKENIMNLLRIVINREYAMELAGRVYSAKNLKKMFNPAKNIICIERQLSPRAIQILTELSEIGIHHPAIDYHIAGAVFSLLAELPDLIKLSEQPVIARLQKEDIRAIHNTEDLLINLLEKDFPGITHLAQVANMSPTKYKQLFSKIFGLSPQRYYTKKKMELAKSLLLSGERRVSEVAHELGYTNISFFTRSFKNFFGITPKQLIGGSDHIQN